MNAEQSGVATRCERDLGSACGEDANAQAQNLQTLNPQPVEIS